jgi:hypothetical protein
MRWAYGIPEYRQNDRIVRPLITADTARAEAAPAVFEPPFRHLRSALATEQRDFDFGSELGVDIADLNSSERRVLSAAITDIQVNSKLWLLDRLFHLVPNGGLTMLVLGAWCGVLPWLANLTGRGWAGAWISIDRDANACSIGKRAFGRSMSNLLFVCHNAYDFDYQRVARRHNLVVINTICEHLDDFSAWRSMLPKGVITVLQSNDYRSCPDHINCVDSTEEFVAKSNLQRVVFQGSLVLPLFTRFMVIGRT